MNLITGEVPHIAGKKEAYPRIPNPLVQMVLLSFTDQFFVKSSWSTLGTSSAHIPKNHYISTKESFSPPLTVHATMTAVRAPSTVSVYLGDVIWSDQALFRSTFDGSVPQTQDVNLRIGIRPY